MYRDPWNTSPAAGSTARAPYQPRNPQQPPRAAQPQTQPPRLDTARFNHTVKAFFENWRPPAVHRGTMPVPRILTGFTYSPNGYLQAQYANPVSQRIEAWGLNVTDFRNGRLTPRCFRD